MLNKLNVNLLDVKADVLLLCRVRSSGVDNRLGKTCYYISEGSAVIISKVTPTSLGILSLIVRYTFSLEVPTKNFSALYIWESRPRTTGTPRGLYLCHWAIRITSCYSAA